MVCIKADGLFAIRFYVTNFVEGIKAFWILQHRRGYPPFVNRMELSVNLSGTL